MDKKTLDEIVNDMTVHCAKSLLKFSELEKEIPSIYLIKGFYAGYSASLLLMGYDFQFIAEANHKSIKEIKKSEFYKFLKK